MTKVQFIKTPRGDELAVLPRRDYERLVRRDADEDAGTARINRKARDELAAGREVALPKAVADRLAAGDNPIRVLRAWRGLTQTELAAETGLAQGYLSGLEAGDKAGSPAALKRIAAALKVPLDALVD